MSQPVCRGTNQHHRPDCQHSNDPRCGTSDTHAREPASRPVIGMIELHSPRQIRASVAALNAADQDVRPARPVYPSPVHSEEPVGNRRFDALFAEAAPLVSSQRHTRDGPPRTNGRWPASIVCRPPSAMAALLESWMWMALNFAGPHHYRTGLAGSAHLTVRALEPRCEGRAPTDPVATSWRHTLSDVAKTTPPLRFRFTGVTLTPGTVMAQMEPADETPWVFMRKLAQSLGSLAWYEEQWPARDIWYVNLVHFAAPIADSEGLLAWVAEHRDIPPVQLEIPSVELVAFELPPHGVPAIVPRTWAREPLAGEVPS